MDFIELKLPLWFITKTLKTHTHTHTHTNEEEKYILTIVWMAGLIKYSTMDFTNNKLPK